jgi:hypothetical protein
MKYVYLMYRDEEQSKARPWNEQADFEQECLACERDLEQSGHLLEVYGLKGSSDSIRVRVLHGQLLLGEGRFAESSGQLIRLFLVDARDLNEAIQTAAKMPHARVGPIEVRPILEPDRLEPPAGGQLSEEVRGLVRRVQ